ncbi:MAG: MOP flippase family protein [Bacteroidales bacterium]|jgi:O-antigen/teichoic acid export membrane protein|nr:MOP flippase family protein [Bacteroidales bacterium]
MELKQKTINSAKWSSLSTVVRILAQIFRLAVLARFLSASDFGLSAIVLLILGFTNIFSDFGINVAILHKQEISKDEYNSLYWFNILVNIGLYCLILCFTPVAVYFYDQPLLKKLIPLAGVDLILIAIGKQFHTVLQKRLDFKVIAIIDIIASVISLLVAYLTALKGFGVYSIIISALSQNLIRSILLMIYGKHPIRLHCEFKEIYSFLKIGVYQTSAQTLDYISNYTDIFIIGKFFSIEQLGFYTLAKELVIKPYQAINSSVNSVIISYLSKLQNDLIKIKQNYLKIVKGLSFINFPIYFFLIFFSNIIVNVYYGTSYIQVAHFVTLLGIWGMFASINSLVGNLTFALGRTDLNFKWTVVRTIANPAVIVLTSLISLDALATGQSILGAIFIYLIWLVILWKLIQVSWREYFSSFHCSFILALIAGAVTKILSAIISTKSYVINLFIWGSVFLIFYYLLSILYNKKSREIIQPFIPKI